MGEVSAGATEQHAPQAMAMARVLPAAATVVIYMGLHGLATVCAKLIEHGLPPDWPAAIVQQGTTPSQRTVTGPLASLPALAEAAQLKAPTLIIVGQTVTLQNKLAWFEHQAWLGN